MGEKEETRHRAMTLVLLERNMTATAFDAYLEADPAWRVCSVMESTATYSSASFRTLVSLMQRC